MYALTPEIVSFPNGYVMGRMIASMAVMSRTAIQTDVRQGCSNAVMVHAWRLSRAVMGLNIAKTGATRLIAVQIALTLESIALWNVEGESLILYPQDVSRLTVNA